MSNNVDFFVEKSYNMTKEMKHIQKGSRIKCNVKLYYKEE